LPFVLDSTTATKEDRPVLCMTTYDQSYVNECRSKIGSQVSAYQALASTAKGPALEAFEPVFFNNLMLALDSYFVHRSRTIESKDGNPLNEVRVLCTSLMSNDGVVAADKSIKLKPASSVLKHEIGDEIKLSEQDFVQMSDAFFAEIESKFV
jgi:hypothetical protein